MGREGRRGHAHRMMSTRGDGGEARILAGGSALADSTPHAYRSSLSEEDTTQYAALISQLAAKARSVIRTLDPNNDLTFLRVRSKMHEIMVAPDKKYLVRCSPRSLAAAARHGPPTLATDTLTLPTPPQLIVIQKPDEA